MVITDKSVFFHIPKTGGMWVRQVLCPIALKPFDPKETKHTLIIPDGHSHKKKFVFVRNPWAWYVSFYNYLVHGSTELWLDQYPSAFFKHYGTSYSFDSFATQLIRRDTDLKTKVIATHRLERMLNAKKTSKDALKFLYLDVWDKSTQSPYNSIISTYTQNVDMIGKMETIREDLKSMLTLSGELTGEMNVSIDSIPMVNKGVDAEYRSYYTTELRDLVAKDSAEYIDKFSYKF
jgi:hypothetical protein